MRKDDVRFILNLNIKDEELEKKIEVALDEYIDKNIDRLVQEKIQQAVDNYIMTYFQPIEGKPMPYYKRERIRSFQYNIIEKIDKVINDKIDERIIYKVGKKLSDLLNDKIEDALS